MGEEGKLFACAAAGGQSSGPPLWHETNISTSSCQVEQGTWQPVPEEHRAFIQTLLSLQSEVDASQCSLLSSVWFVMPSFLPWNALLNIFLCRVQTVHCSQWLFFPAVIPTSGGLGSRAGHYWSHSLDYSIPGVLRSITDWRLDRSRIPWGCNIVSRRELKNIPLSRKGEVLFECQAEASEGIGIFLFKLVPFLLHFATLFSKLNFPWRGEASLVLKRAPLQYNRTFSSLAGETKN